MKSKLILKPHSVLSGESIIEIWFGNRFVGTVVGGDFPGVRVISKYPARSINRDALVTEVMLNTLGVPAGDMMPSMATKRQAGE